MTYRELRNILNNYLTEEQLDSDLSLLNVDRGDCFPMLDFVHDWKTHEKDEVGLDMVKGTLDDNHPYFTYAE